MHPTAHVLDLVSLGHYHQPAGRHPTPFTVRHGEEVIELMTGGRGWVDHDGEWQEVLPGDLIWQVAGDQTIGRSDFTDPYRCLSVRVRVTGGATDLGSLRPAPRFSRWDDLDEVRSFTRQAIRWASTPGVDRGALVAWLYGRLVFQGRLVPAPPSLPEPLVRVLTLIDGAFAEDLGIGAMATTARRSASQLHALFRTHLDTTPHAYLAERRLRAARELLATTDLSVADIAVSCGFSAAAPFCRAFRTVVGTSPAAWRQQQRRGR